MWLWHCSAKQFSSSYYFSLSLYGVCAFICTGRDWQEGPAPASLPWQGNQYHQTPECRLAPGVRLFGGVNLKAPQCFAKEHQGMISLISFTSGQPFPSSPGLPVPAEGWGRTLAPGSHSAGG